MQFGMPTLLETTTLMDCALLCRELGLDFIELNMNLPQYQTANIKVHEFADIAQRYGIYYTIHLDENLNPCDFNPLVAKAYMDTVLVTIEAAKALHVPVLNMHLNHGVHFKMPNENIYLFDAYLETYLSGMKAFCDACERAIGGSGIKICVENTDGHYHLFSQKALQQLMESDVFALTFDIGHNHVIGGSDEGIILKHENKLCHMHMHDALGPRCHLALGTGEINLENYFDLARKLDLRVVLETKTIDGLTRSVSFAHTYFSTLPQSDTRRRFL
jgi:sugar phosphate isomerase/epimerase